MPSYHEVMDVNAKSAPSKGKPAKKEIRRLEHERSSNGGHVFNHSFHQSGGPYIESETHTFGADEGRKALEHFAEHSGLSEHLTAKGSEKPKEEEPGEGEEEESSAGAAY